MSTTENGWTAEDELRRIADLMKDEMASYPSQREIVHIALKALADKQSEVEQLTEELAGWRGRELQHCMERDMGRVDGTTAGDLLRTTDTHKTFEWVPGDGFTGRPAAWVLRADHPA